MKINFNISLFAIILLAGIVLALLYTNRSVRGAHRETISALDSASTAFEVYRLKTNVRVSAQRAVILSYRDAINLGLIEINRLEGLNIKKVEVNIRLTERIAILEREAEYDKPPVIVYIDSSDINSDTIAKYIQIPMGFGYSDKWVSLHATVDETPMFDTIVFWSFPEITLAWQKQGFLKKKQRKIFYINKNPYVTIIDMNNVVIEEPKKWYQTDIAKVSGGIVAFEIIRTFLIQ